MSTIQAFFEDKKKTKKTCHKMQIRDSEYKKERRKLGKEGKKKGQEVEQ